ncbi:MAG: hypothetical protein QOG62_2082, partial [Thermoleophilaceae bacterium]|nr:hypothetical protein [Thermoleophilaceae bacterium]
ERAYLMPGLGDAGDRKFGTARSTLAVGGEAGRSWTGISTGRVDSRDVTAVQYRRVI